MRGLSLDILASLNFGIKKDLSGRLMPNLWKSGEKEKVIKHLMDDVKLTRKLFNHVEKNKKLKYEHFDYGESRGTQELKIPKGLFKLEGR